MALTAVLAAAQMAAGLGKNIANAVKRKNFDPKMTSATDRAIDETRRMSTTTEAVGSSAAREGIRQATADTVGQMQQQTGDANKIVGAASRANLQALQSGRQVDAAAEAQRLQGSQQYAQALSRGAQEEQQDQARFDQQMAGKEAEASNLMGAGASNLMSLSRDNKMLDIYSKINAGESITPDMLKQYDKLPGQGSGWTDKFRDFMFNKGEMSNKSISRSVRRNPPAFDIYNNQENYGKGIAS